ncbi:hypothetical protein pipiens_000442, partial [Culex pipiens pipiens]
TTTAASTARLRRGPRLPPTVTVATRRITAGSLCHCRRHRRARRFR